MYLRKLSDKILRRFAKSYTTHNRIEVSAGALLHNLRVFAEITRQPAIPVLKGNAYGHGIELVAQALRGQSFPYIAVDGYFEALRVREVSRQPVLIMGSIPLQNYKSLVYRDFAFVVHDVATVHALGTTGKRVKVHLECNTGMNRYGAKIQDIPALVEAIASYKNLTLEGIMSHLADSDGDDPQTVHEAVAEFDQCVESIHALGQHPTLIHIGQSAGSLKVASRYANAFRLGLGLYGLQPFGQGHSLREKLQDLRPALRLISTITKIVDLEAGDKVSYNYTFTAPKAMKMAVIPLGYFEGLPRALSNQGSVKIGNSYAPIIGRICMNHTMISLEGIDAKVGDEVVVFSDALKDNNTIDKIADTHGLFGYAMLTSLSSDTRRYLVS